jgi:hypothetical protein
MVPTRIVAKLSPSSNRGRGNRSGQVLDFVPIDGEDDLLLSQDSSFLSLPPQFSLWMEAMAIVPVRSLTRLLVEARMIHFLVVILCFYRSPPVGLALVLIAMAVTLGGGHCNHSGQVLGVVTGGGEDCPVSTS